MDLTAVSGARLADDLRVLGVRPGGVLMVHTRMSALGWVIGGTETIVRALLEVLGPDGTLVVYASWQEHVYRAEDRPAEHREAYAAAPPAFDPATGEVDRDYGRLPSACGRGPGRCAVVPSGGLGRGDRRRGPRGSPRAPRRRRVRRGSPFARLVEADGQVLMLGAPLDTVTLLHHAEAIARVPASAR